MPSRPIDTAYVAILPDVTRFRPTLTRELDTAFHAMGATVDRAASDVGRSFEHAGVQMGDAVGSAATSAEQSLTHVGVAASGAAEDMTTSFRRAAVGTEGALAGVGATADHEMDRIDRHVTATAAGMNKKFGIAALGIQAALFGVGIATVTGLTALTTMGLKSAATLEQTKISFDALVGSAQEGQKVFDSLQQFAAVTPFQFQDVAGAAKRFLAFASSVGLTKSELEHYLTTIGNVISVTGGGGEAFGRISLAIGQIGSASKVTLDNLNQIADAIPGFSPIQAIASSLGITTAEAMKRITAGSVPAAVGVQALLKGMEKFPGAAGAMEKQSQTLLGVFSTFKDVVSLTLSKAFEPAIPAIKQTLNDVTPLIGDALGKIAPALGGLLAAILPLIGNLIKAITPILTPLVTAIGPALAALGPVLEPLGVALSQIVIPLLPLIPLVAQLALILVQVLVPVLAFLAVVLKPLEPLLAFVAKAVGEFATALTMINWDSVGNSIAHAFTIAWHAVSAFFVGAARWFALLPFRILSFLTGLPDLLGRMFKRALDRTLILVGMGIGLIIASFTTLPELIFRVLVHLDEEGTRMFGRFLLGLGEMALSGIKDLVGLFVRLPFMIVDALTGLGPLLLHLIGTAFDRARDRAVNALLTIVRFVQGLPARLIGFAADVGGGIVHFVIRAINNAIDKLNQGIARVDDVIPGDLPRLPHLARGAIAMRPSITGEAGPEANIPLGDPRALAMLRQAGLGGGPTVNFAPGAIVINVEGSMTGSQAQQVGHQIGTSIADELSHAGIRTAVRMVGAGAGV